MRHDADGSHAVKFILMDGRESIIATARRPHPIPNKLVNIATVISLINNKRDHFDFLKLILINIFCHHAGKEERNAPYGALMSRLVVNRTDTRVSPANRRAPTVSTEIRHVTPANRVSDLLRINHSNCDTSTGTVFFSPLIHGAHFIPAQPPAVKYQ